MFMTTIMPLNNVHDYYHGHDGDLVGGDGILPCSLNAFNEDADDVAVFFGGFADVACSQGTLMMTILRGFTLQRTMAQ